MSDLKECSQFYFLLALFVCSCSTSTKTANVTIAAFDTVAMVGAAAAGSVPAGSVLPFGTGIQHQIHVKGVILCEKNLPINYYFLQVEFLEKDKLTSIISVSETGSFESIHKTFTGEHLLRLVEKRTGKVLDQISFTSTEQVDRFVHNLRACR